METKECFKCSIKGFKSDNHISTFELFLQIAFYSNYKEGKFFDR